MLAPHLTGVDDPTCPLCLRPIPPGTPASRHHWVPVLKGGRNGPTALLHHICHQAIHARFTEAELARRLHSAEALRAAPEMGAFLAWVGGKPPGFHAPTRLKDGRRGRLRR